MAARRKRRRGLVIAAAVLVLSLAAIALLVARPARVVSVGEGSLADSLRAEADGEEAGCVGLEGGRSSGSVWRCTVRQGGTYAVQADEWGCWEAERIDGSGERRLDACIWLGDYVPVLD